MNPGRFIEIIRFLKDYGWLIILISWIALIITTIKRYISIISKDIATKLKEYVILIILTLGYISIFFELDRAIKISNVIGTISGPIVAYLLVTIYLQKKEQKEQNREEIKKSKEWLRETKLCLDKISFISNEYKDIETILEDIEIQWYLEDNSDLDGPQKNLNEAFLKLKNLWIEAPLTEIRKKHGYEQSVYQKIEKTFKILRAP